MPHHIQDGDNVGSQPGHVTPDSQSGSLCTGSDTSLFFLLLMLLRSICHQVSNQSDKFDLAIIIFADVALKKRHGLRKPTGIGGRNVGKK